MPSIDSFPWLDGMVSLLVDIQPNAGGPPAQHGTVVTETDGVEHGNVFRSIPKAL